MSATLVGGGTQPPPTHVIVIQSKDAAKQPATAQQQQQLQQHAQPPGMLQTDEQHTTTHTQAPSTPTVIPVQPQPKGGRPTNLTITTVHQQNASLTPQQVLAKNQALAAQQNQLQGGPGVLQEQSLSGSYYSDEDADAESSDDESPRENRVLTFADEHGKNLVALHWYDPDPGEDNRGTTIAQPTGSGEDIVDTGCGAKCVIL
jgi:hypothetical protein